MVRAWYMDSSEEDQRLEHQRQPPQFIDLDELFKATGVEYFKLNPDDPVQDEKLEKIKHDRHYTYEDQLTCSKECLPNFEEKLRSFYTEHLHTDEEIRLVLQGSGYFDVRDGKDEWIRIEVLPGDMIVIPAGIYHRFTLDTKLTEWCSVMVGTPGMHLECMGLMCSLWWTLSSVSPLLLDSGIVPHSRPEDIGRFNIQTENCITSANFITAKRFFIGEPVWTPHNRPADDMECRKLYLHKLNKGF